MAIISFLITVAGATMLLLFAVKMVRNSIERSLGATLRKVLTKKANLAGSSLTGVMLAILLQSSAAVALLASGFMASGYLKFSSGLAIVLGGDFGAALLIQILSFKMDLLIPVLLSIGGWLFVKTKHKKRRQLGRALMGIALILVSLQFLRDAMDPVRNSNFLPEIANYLARDFITAFLIGAVLAFVMHSSVAAILMCVTLVQINAITFPAALSLLLGANLGSAFIPVWLAREAVVDARRILVTNLLLRGSWAILALLGFNLIADPSTLVLAEPGQSLIYAHIGFNGSLIVLAIPFHRKLELLTIMLMPGDMQNEDDFLMSKPANALDHAVLNNSKQSIACLKRELLRMTDIIECMFETFPQMYRGRNRKQISALQSQDKFVYEALSNIRSFVAKMPTDKYSTNDIKMVRGLMDYAVRLESAGDVIAKRLSAVSKQMREEKVFFSDEGWLELLQIYESIRGNLELARNVLVSDDIDSARILVEEKSGVKKAERNSRKRHFARLQNGREESFASSDMHLETLRAFRDINGHISAVAQPILYRNGQLLETRLVQNNEIG